MKKTLFALVSFFVPAIALGQTSNMTADAGGLVNLFGVIIASLIPIASMLAILFFFYGLALYILKAGDPDAAAEGKSIMIWGILALFVMVSIYGIIGFLQRSTGTDETATAINVITPTFTPATVNYMPGY
ncbi:MAG: hypothetical protein WCT49_02775 [Candidatus Paceibacterota bacterium]|jgi:hypothetical protein|nr:hypothetical protein [Candidatus Paceibacterota bacterium]